ncbi:MAG: S-layer homology domain-containing protein [Oscillospiraceae bacterium]|nr:S-layer homology domain-containing protein [Oscillospiraceae bacterium]
MEAVLAEHPDPLWKVVALHHSLYTVASHAYDESILARREELVPLFHELDIDVVLSGHDHVYCRSYIMDGLEPLGDPDIYDQRSISSVTNPDGVLYVTANSSSGSKTYKPKEDIFPYSAAQHQYHVGELSRVSVTESSFSIETYRTDTMEQVDRFTIFRKDEIPHPFTDVTSDQWYDRAVQYAYTHGTMNGVEETRFSPNTPTSRAMFVTILHRLDGGKTAKAATFEDVPSTAYYANAVNWAAENGIVTGVSASRFAPDQEISREQLVTMLARYAAYLGKTVPVEDQTEGYTDASLISPYALSPINWALQEGLLVGTSSDRLSPQSTATRAQVAQIIMRLQKLLAE